MLSLLAILALLAAGLPLALALRLRLLTAVAASPALIIGIIGLLTLVRQEDSGMRWRAEVWLIAVLVVIASLGLKTLHTRRRPPGPRPARGELIALGNGFGAGLIGAVLAGVSMGGLGTPLERRDPIVHMNQVAGIVHGWTGVGPIGNTTWLTGMSDTSNFYPSTFHALAAAIPGNTVVVCNLLVLTTIVLWAVGVAAFAVAAFPNRPAVWTLAPWLTLFTISFPLVPLARHGQWPFGLSTALLPAVLAVLFNAAWSSRVRLGHWLAFALGSLGILLIQPAGLMPVMITVVLLAALIVIFAVASMSRKSPVRPGPLSVGISVVVLVGFVAVGFTLPRLELYRTMANYERAPFDPLGMMGAAVGWGHTDQWESTGATLSVVLGALTVLGLFLFLYYRLLLGLVSFATLIILAGSTSMARVTRVLAAPWYRDPERLEAVFALFAVLAVALALDWLASGVTTLVARWRPQPAWVTSAVAVALALAVCVPGLADRMYSRNTAIVAQNYHPAEGNELTIGSQSAWSEEDRRIWSEVASQVSEGEAVFGEPSSGAGLLPATMGIKAVPAVPALDQAKWGATEVTNALRDGTLLPEDSYGCQFVRDENIHYFYVDPSPGTRFVDANVTREGAATHGTIIAEEGPRAIYRMESCW
ncbi:MAG: hypothetical protein Q4P33_01080 [Flaviflexus sp.]|nr:hypothetical protein [Flaviflexus sp.]